MSPATSESCRIGLVVNRLVAERVAALVDEYGALCGQSPPGSDRGVRLRELLLSITRSMRLESVEGERYRLERHGDLLFMRKK